ACRWTACWRWRYRTGALSRIRLRGRTEGSITLPRVPCSSGPWANVLVQTEQVRRIVLVLEPNQPLLDRCSIGGPDAVLALFTDEAHERAPGGERLDRRGERAGPLDVPVGVRWTGPCGHDVHGVLPAAQADRRLRLLYPAHRPAKLHHRDGGQRGGH